MSRLENLTEGSASPPGFPPVRPLYLARAERSYPSSLDTGIRLWRIDLGSAFDREKLLFLSVEERTRARRFVFEADRRRYEAAHLSMRQLIGAQLGLGPGDVSFSLGPHGKPHLTTAASGSFNLSHSGDVALLLWSDGAGECGVDVEIRKPVRDRDRISRQVFTSRECETLDTTKEADKDAAFLRLWARKEACIKALGTGLSLEPRSFEVGLDGAHSEHQIILPAGLAATFGPTASILVCDVDAGTDVVAAAAFRLTGVA